MAFKIKDGVRIGTVDVFNNSGTLLVNAPTADKWSSPRTITLAGDLTGNVSIDGSANVTLTATVAADSVALGTDTTGNYAAAVTAGAGITVTGTAGEGTTFTVAHEDTSSQASVDNSGNTFIQDITLDTYGHITQITSAAVSIGSGTLALTATAGSTNTAVTIGTGTGFDANSSAGVTYDIDVGPALTNLATTMTGAGSGFLKKNGADTYVVDTNTYLTAEADTLATVTGRGATTGTAISITNSTASTTTGTGALIVSGGVGIGGALNVGGAAGVGGNLTVAGNLIVNGTTTTVNSTITTLDDPVLTLGGDTAPTADDNKDRGVEFRWHNGTSAKIGFFGFDDSTGKFTFIPDATNSTEVFSGTKGALDATLDWADVTSKPNIVNSISFGSTGLTPATATSGAVTVAGTLAVANGGTGATTAPNARTNLGATTVGSNIFTLTNPGAITFIRLNADNTVSTLDAATFRSAIGAGTGTVTSVATGTGLTGGPITSTGTVSLTGQALALHNLATNGIIARTGAGTVAARTITAGSGITVTNGDGVSGNPTISASFTESDTLSTVTARGNTTNTGIVLQDTSTNVSLSHAKTATVASTTTTAVDTFPIATYRSAKYLVQITQGSAYQVSEVLVLQTGTTTTMTEYAVLESGTALATLSSEISGSDARLLVTMASATSATIRIHKVLMAV